MASPTLSPNVLTPACEAASRWQRTWSPCALGRICAWRSWALRHTSRRGHNRTKPQDLIDHNCITLRLPHGGLYAWEFEKAGRELRVRVEGQLTYNTTVQMLKAALAGLGLAYLPEGLARPHIASGRLKRVLEDWCLPYSGYHLY